jgi:hypothetical protein
MKRMVMATAVALALCALGGLAAHPAAGDKVVVVNNYYGGEPFLYGGYTYIPLRNVKEALGAVLLWDSVKRQAVITYNGHELGLVVGSSVAYLDGAEVGFPVAPVIIHDHVFVPTTVVRGCLHVPVTYDSSRRELRIRGPEHWSLFRINPRPGPGTVAAVTRHPPQRRMSPGASRPHGDQGTHHGKGPQSKGNGKGGGKGKHK